jgi:hypothetical protein
MEFTEWIPELRRTLQALSRPATDQRRLFPSLVCVADELALDFDDALRAAGEGASVLFTAEQSTALARLNSRLDELSGSDAGEFWTDAALSSDPRWNCIRSLARDALRAFAWPEEQPAPGTRTYVR